MVDGRPALHISLVMDVSPNCDCHFENDLAIVPNVGMFVSYDPVALDLACADAVNSQPAIPGSVLGDCGEHHDHFKAMGPDTDWRSGIEHGVKIGLGRDEYELIKV